jgi:hypothetical protein
MAMAELLQNGMFIFWGAITLMVLVPSLAHYWWQSRKAEMDNALKREMIQRGMSADEIERVLKAKSKE